MADERFSLDLLGPVILETRDELRSLRDDVHRMRDERFPAVDRTLSNHHDDITVLTAMVMRYSSEPIAWATMQAEIRKLAERIEALERK